MPTGTTVYCGQIDMNIGREAKPFGSLGMELIIDQPRVRADICQYLMLVAMNVRAAPIPLSISYWTLKDMGLIDQNMLGPTITPKGLQFIADTDSNRCPD